MNEGYVATTSPALEDLSGFVHDEWFRLEDIEHTAGRDDVRIELTRGAVVRERFGWQSIEKGSERAGTLIIRKVRGLEIDDEAQVGDYEVDRLTAAENDTVVQLHATIPLRIDFRVDAIDVEFVPATDG